MSRRKNKQKDSPTTYWVILENHLWHPKTRSWIHINDDGISKRDCRTGRRLYTMRAADRAIRATLVQFKDAHKHITLERIWKFQLRSWSIVKGQNGRDY